MSESPDIVTIEPSGGIFGHRGCEVYTYTRSRGDEGWMVAAQYLNGMIAVAPVDSDEPLRRPVIAALDACWSRRRWPYRAVLLRAHDQAGGVAKAVSYFQRIDEHVFGIDPRAVADAVGSRVWRC